MSNLDLTRRARRVIPGGVNSHYRALPWPLCVVKAEGATFTDADGRRYLDYNCAFGPVILGHNHPGVNAAVRATMERIDITGVGISDLEIELAETMARH